MRVEVLQTAGRAAASAARLVARALEREPSLVLGLPTGRTAIPFYEALVALYRRGVVDFRRATTFNLDELAGVKDDDPRSYHAYMRRHLFDHVNLNPRRTHLPDGAAGDWTREVARYERHLSEAGGLGLAVIGIGRNGHIGFNEPSARLEARTHYVKLQPASRRANAYLARGDWREVPTHAVSMGIGTILQARTVVLLATGASKASIVARALEGPITTRVPASLIQAHPAAIAILDREAAGRLSAARRRGAT